MWGGEGGGLFSPPLAPVATETSLRIAELGEKAQFSEAGPPSRHLGSALTGVSHSASQPWLRFLAY